MLNEASQRERDRHNDLSHMEDIKKHTGGITNTQRKTMERKNIRPAIH